MVCSLSIPISACLQEPDSFLAASTTYGAVAHTIQYLSDRSEQPKPSVYNVTYTFPLKHSEIVEIFRARIREVKQKHASSKFTDVPEGALLPEGVQADPKGNRIVALIDSITSNPGVALPWRDLVRVCKEEGVWSVIDAAHSIGQEVFAQETLHYHQRIEFVTDEPESRGDTS